MRRAVFVSLFFLFRGSGETLRTLEGHSDWVTALAVLPDGRVVSSSKDNTLRVWDAGSESTLAGYTLDVQLTALASLGGQDFVVGDISGSPPLLPFGGAWLARPASAPVVPFASHKRRYRTQKEGGRRRPNRDRLPLAQPPERPEEDAPTHSLHVRRDP
jgi:hypothetical protein